MKVVIFTLRPLYSGDSMNRRLDVSHNPVWMFKKREKYLPFPW
jgi:hypothetical protein